MKYSESVSMAVKNIQNNKVRSFLTMLGIIIGVAAVIAMTSLGEGAKKQVTDRIQQMGSNLIIVSPGRSGRGSGFASANSITTDIIEVIAESSMEIEAIAPEIRTGRLVRVGDNSLQTSIIGCSANYETVRNYQVAAGRFFTPEEEQGKRRVAVIGSYIASELFPDSDPIGSEIKIDRVRMKIIGVLAEKGQSGFSNSDDLVLAPLATVQQRLTGNKNLSSISIQVRQRESMELVYNQVYQALLNELEDETKFNVNNMTDMLAAAQDMTKTFTLLLAGIAAVSLLVGGIGIMNIMLVSVTERIREIGIRKAIGAQKEEILSMFLIEAVALSLAGGLTGILLGFAFSFIVGKILNWATVITFSSIVIAFVFSIIVGLFFGVYPAYKAAELNPIEALRHE